MKRRSAGFTLVELLIIIVIISTLAALLLPAIKSAQASAESVKCVNNLRQLGVVAITYAADNKQCLPLVWDGTLYWAEHFCNAGLLTFKKKGPRNFLTEPSMYCPSLKSGVPIQPDGSFNSAYMYGMRFTGTLEENKIIFSNISSPSTYFVFADTVKPDTSQQSYKFYIGASPTVGQVHRRHRNRANVWFADGHVSACSDGDLKLLNPSFVSYP